MAGRDRMHARMHKIKINHPGAYHEELGIPKGDRIPLQVINRDVNSTDPVTRKRAIFAKNARGWNK